MKKVNKKIIITPGFCSADTFAATTEITERVPQQWDEKWLFLNKYPLPTVQENEENLINIAKRFGYQIHDSLYDRGLAGSVNYFFQEHPQPPGTMVWGRDPDVAIDEVGCKNLDNTFKEIFEADDSIGMLAFHGEVFHYEYTTNRYPYKTEYPAGHRIESTVIGAIESAMLDLDWMLSTGGSDLPFNDKYYGNQELCWRDKLIATKKRLAYVWDCGFPAPSWKATTCSHFYYKWKWLHLQRTVHCSFEEWLPTYIMPINELEDFILNRVEQLKDYRQLPKKYLEQILQKYPDIFDEYFKYHKYYLEVKGVKTL